jgi:hypothetical protein
LTDTSSNSGKEGATNATDHGDDESLTMIPPLFPTIVQSLEPAERLQPHFVLLGLSGLVGDCMGALASTTTATSATTMTDSTASFSSARLKRSQRDEGTAAPTEGSKQKRPKR